MQSITHTGGDEMERGNVLMHRKSHKLYTILWAGLTQPMADGQRHEHISYIGLRNGRNYGPVRVGSPTVIARTFVVVPDQTALFASEHDWNSHHVLRVEAR